MKWKVVKYETQSIVAELFVYIIYNSLQVEIVCVGRTKEALGSKDLDIDL